ncbi:MAG: hypothetical protein V2I36_03165 [Desulfopila sp.]|jgi:hypothetical protein|nr:hypothetical protein [Desulfopila sp.]
MASSFTQETVLQTLCFLAAPTLPGNSSQPGDALLFPEFGGLLLSGSFVPQIRIEAAFFLRGTALYEPA